MKFAVVVPTLNAMTQWAEWHAALRRQSEVPELVVILDSQSDDGTAEAAAACGFFVVTIERSRFDHGGTRQLAVRMLPQEVEVVVYLTQDAILADQHSVRDLLVSFEDPTVGMAYGRQLPRPGAGPIEAHARLFNYPPGKQVRGYADKARLGIKTAFCSNSFAAYRRTALETVGGFPGRTILAEEMVVGARMLKAGWRIAYAADAVVAHSHGYTVVQEFRRYFDVGVLHAREPWLTAEFGKAEGEGVKFVISELKWLARRTPWLMPVAMLRTLTKMAGYRAGRVERKIALPVKQVLSMNKGFWFGEAGRIESEPR